jgi:hypothetical protein
MQNSPHSLHLLSVATVPKSLDQCGSQQDDDADDDGVSEEEAVVADMQRATDYDDGEGEAQSCRYEQL